MEFRDCVTVPTMVGMGMAQVAAAAAQELRHGRDLRRAQGWVDHLAASARAADADFRAVVGQLAQARREAATLRDALDAADEENLDLSLQIRAMKARH